MEYKSASEAVKVIKSGDTVFIHGIAQAPQILIDAMVARAPELNLENLVIMPV